jgi:glucose-6-phosphate-specific signal transduction histidine kinase
LYPPYIDEIDFVELVGRLGSVFESRFRTSVNVDSSIDRLTLPPQTQRILFRSIRELLINFIKHDTSGSVGIAIMTGENHLNIELTSAQLRTRVEEVRENIDRKKRYGIFMLRENLSLIGGRLALDREKGAFSITIKLQE